MTETATAARHSCDSPEWYTPSPFVEAAREVMGGIDLDPASHDEANVTVKADRFYTAEESGLDSPWHGRIFLNPPGGLVKEFWSALLWEYGQGRVKQAIWIGYSLEQLQTLQNAKGYRTPLDFPICVTARRIAFVENEAKRLARIEKWTQINEGRAALGGILKRISHKAASPSHSQYITYIGQNTEAFYTVFSQFGQVR